MEYEAISFWYNFFGVLFDPITTLEPDVSMRHLHCYEHNEVLGELKLFRWVGSFLGNKSLSFNLYLHPSEAFATMSFEFNHAEETFEFLCEDDLIQWDADYPAIKARLIEVRQTLLAQELVISHEGKIWTLTGKSHLYEEEEAQRLSEQLGGTYQAISQTTFRICYETWYMDISCGQSFPDIALSELPKTNLQDWRRCQARIRQVADTLELLARIQNS